MTGTKRMRAGLAMAVLASAAVVAGASPASANVGQSASLTATGTVAVGDMGSPGSFTLTNTNTPPHQAQSNTVTLLHVAPGCGSVGTTANACPTPDVGVLALDSPATGDAGTACAGLTFTPSAPDASGIVTLTPSSAVVLAPPGGAPGSNQCKVNFSFDTLQQPTIDADAAAGVQTRFNVRASSTGAGLTVTNAVSVLIRVNPSPHVLSIADDSRNERDTATAPLRFDVALSAPSASDVTVDYATSDGNATAGPDYKATSGTLTIPAGETTGKILVKVKGDVLDETDEAFVLTLSDPTGATIGLGTGIGTILDDDDPPDASIGDQSVLEGDDGSTLVTFTVTLSGPSGQTIDLDFATANDTAVAPGDYTAKSGHLQILPGKTVVKVTVKVKGDVATEGSEQFFVVLSNPAHVNLADAVAIGTIQEDDGVG